MDGDELVTLLGHSSVDSPLDNFLTLHNILIRPKGNSGSYLLSDKSHGLDFEYKESQDFESMSLIVAPTKGKFNLISVEFKSKASKKQQPYMGRLPFGLEFSMSPNDVTRVLGNPKDGLQSSETSGSISIEVQTFKR